MLFGTGPQTEALPSDYGHRHRSDDHEVQQEQRSGEEPVNVPSKVD